MINLGKVLKTSHINDHNWKTSLQCFLGSYRATLHCTTSYPPTKLIFNKRLYKTRLHSATINTDLFRHKEVQENDHRQNAETKRKPNNRAYVKTANLQTDDNVLCQQPRPNKLKSANDPIPYTIAKINGSQITATNETRMIKRHITFFKCYKSASNQDQHPKPRLQQREGQSHHRRPVRKEGSQTVTQWETSQTTTQWETSQTAT